MRIDNIKHITGDKWLVIYYEPLPCMCRDIRKDISITSKKKPSEDRIKKEIEKLKNKLNEIND